MRQFVLLSILCGTLFAGRAAICQSSPPTVTVDTPAATTPANSDTLYEDPTANSSVTVTQILPNSSTAMMTFGAVKRIRVRQDILIIEWGTTATTLLPRQFVGSLTVNKHSDTAKDPRNPPHAASADDTLNSVRLRLAK